MVEITLPSLVFFFKVEVEVEAEEAVQVSKLQIIFNNYWPKAK